MTQTSSPDTSSRRRVFLSITAILVIGLGLMQVARFIVPEFKIDNPAVTHTVVWDSPETERLWQQSCADCHSNETIYPWYSYIAPVGWLVAHDTHDGRRELNISENHRIELDEMVEVIQEEEMPPSTYTIMHPQANLSAADQQALIDGLRKTFAGR
jgi:hypothetical protein